MKTIPATILILVFVSASWTGWRLVAQPGSYIVGGSYILHSGEVITGDLNALFAQVTIEEGARVMGRMLLVSSTLDMNAAVPGGILSINSDVTIRPAAQVGQSLRQVDAIPYVILLPEIARAGIISRR